VNDEGVSGVSAHGDPLSGDLARVGGTMLRDALRWIPKLLRRAAETGEVEAIHKMRVGTRRAGAALFAFEDLVEDRRALAGVTAVLDRVRRSGSKARACDVDLRALSVRLDSCDDPSESAAIGFVMSRLGENRARGQQRVERRWGRFDRGSYRAHCKRMCQSIRTDGKTESVTEWAMKRVGMALEAVWALGNAADMSDEQLHELRIALKRLRYQAELFEPVVVWSGWRGMIEASVECQERLGHANDASELAARVRRIGEQLEGGATGWSSGLAEGLDRLASGLEREGRASGAAARAWWHVEGRRSVDRLVGSGSTRGSNGPMMDLDAAMDAALTDARRSLDERGSGG